MTDAAAMVRFSIRPVAGAWRWTTFDARDAQRDTGVVASKAIAAALVIRDICRAQTIASSSAIDPVAGRDLERAA